jgi:hypothetical protein
MTDNPQVVHLPDNAETAEVDFGARNFSGFATFEDSATQAGLFVPNAH